MQDEEPAEGNEGSRGHYVRPANEPYVPPAPVVYSRWERFTRLLGRIVDGKTPSDWNPLVPRGYDGKRTKMFFFNGNGRR